MASILVGLTGIMFTIFLTFSMWVWTKIGIWLVMKSSRSTEFEADQFSWKLGYGEDLCALLHLIDGFNAKGLYAHLASSHPSKHHRIAKLQELGAADTTIYEEK